jgi:hypothetical protein
MAHGQRTPGCSARAGGEGLRGRREAGRNGYLNFSRPVSESLLAGVLLGLGDQPMTFRDKGGDGMHETLPKPEHAVRSVVLA